MELTSFCTAPGEQPLDRLIPDGGLCAVFRTLGCIGDSLSSGEFEGTDETGKKTYHDFMEYSWGQYIARAAGLKAYNFSRGGMTAKEYCESFAEANGFWSPDLLCQAYVIALGVNDLVGQKQPVGSLDDIDPDDPEKNAPTFTGYYAKIIGRIRKMQPQARFFLVTMPRNDNPDFAVPVVEQGKAIHRLAGYFPYTYVIDLARYAPVYDQAFKKRFYLGGHMNPAGYLLTARMIASYIDFLIRQNPEDFAQVGFIGTPYHNRTAKW